MEDLCMTASRKTRTKRKWSMLKAKNLVSLRRIETMFSNISNKIKSTENLIRGLDDDEVQFLDLVDQNRLVAERKQQKDEEKELNEYRERVKDLQEKSIDMVSKTKLYSGLSFDSFHIFLRSFNFCCLRFLSVDFRFANLFS